MREQTAALVDEAVDDAGVEVHRLALEGRRGVRVATGSVAAEVVGALVAGDPDDRRAVGARADLRHPGRDRGRAVEVDDPHVVVQFARMSRGRALRSLIGALAGAAALGGVVPATAGAQTGGPVILGGDDLTAHGGVDPGTGASEGGWLYLERAVARIRAGVVRPNDNTIAAFGSADPGVPGPPGDAGAAIRNAATKNGSVVGAKREPAATRRCRAACRAGRSPCARRRRGGSGSRRCRRACDR